MRSASLSEGEIAELVERLRRMGRPWPWGKHWSADADKAVLKAADTIESLISSLKKARGSGYDALRLRRRTLDAGAGQLSTLWRCNEPDGRCASPGLCSHENRCQATDIVTRLRHEVTVCTAEGWDSTAAFLKEAANEIEQLRTALTHAKVCLTNYMDRQYGNKVLSCLDRIDTALLNKQDAGVAGPPAERSGATSLTDKEGRK